jgi:ribulose-phosphate 3-epimerase
MRVGVALKPATPASSVFHLVETKAVDMVLVMTVEPGFGGQAFMDSCMPKVIIHFTD